MFRILKPLYGDKLARLEEVYLLSDDGEKREIESELNLIYFTVLRSFPEPLLPPPPETMAHGQFLFGNIVYNGMAPEAWGISKEQLRRHLLVAGATGSGKTNAVVVLLKRLTESKMPWLVLDPLRAYRGLKDQAHVYTIGRTIAPLQISLLQPPPGTGKREWIAKVVDVLAQALDFGEGASQILNGALSADEGIEGATQRLSARVTGSRAKGWGETATRALRMLSEGGLARFFEPGPDPSALLTQNVILEIDALSETEKSIFSDLLVLWMHHFRLSQQKQILQHVLVIEEAHHLLHASGRVKERPVERFLREARGLGQGIIVVDQQPSTLTSQVIAQCGTRITFQLAERDDLSAASKYSLISHDELGVFGRLPIGHAIVKMNSRWFEPFLVKFDIQQENERKIADSEIQSSFRIDSVDSGKLEAPEEERGLIPLMPLAHTWDVDVVLENISQEPFTGVLERSRRLGWSTRRIASAIRIAVGRGLLNRVKIQTSRRPLVLFQPSERGIERMKKLGLKLPSGGRLGGIAHRYWINEIARGFEDLGFEVKREVVFGAKVLDMVALKTSEKLLIEVETGGFI